MLLLPVWKWLEEEVFSLPEVVSGPKPRFNPYRGVNLAVDRPGADSIRRENLRGYLVSFEAWPEALVIGEAPGWKGCRFSGVPFTSEAQLTGSLPFHGEPSSLGCKPHTEAAATIFWQVMLRYHPRFLIWNSLPLHLHQPERPLSNRTPSLVEIRQSEALLAQLVALLKPQQVIAVGRSAATAAMHLGLAANQVRHPGHGGAKAFFAGMQAILGEESQP